MEGFSKTQNYAQKFFNAKAHLYFEMMKDAGSAHFPPAFKGEDEIIQMIQNIVHNINDRLLDLSVPEMFPSPNILIHELEAMQNLAENQLARIIEINIEQDNSWYDCVTQAYTINHEVNEALKHALSLSKSVKSENESILLAVKICEKIKLVSKQLLFRRKEGDKPRETLKIKDEYDVQDLLHALLKIEFEDIRPEEWCPSYAGSSKRMDFLLKNERLVIEVKKTRNGLGQKEVGEELIVDIANYKKHPDCSHLICLIWDTDNKIVNPKGLENDLTSEFVTIRIIH